MNPYCTIKAVEQWGKWRVKLQIDCQGFYLMESETKKDAVWMAKMLRIAIKKIQESK